MMFLEATVNGAPIKWHIRPDEFLTEVLRRQGLIGTKRGCEQGDCGACAVLLDGREINSCILLAAQAGGHDIVTVEGLSDGRNPTPMQEAFVDTGAIQCGFCTPGMLIGVQELLDETPNPTEAQAREALAGHLCRCTGHIKPIDAVIEAARRVRDAGRD